MSSSRIARYKTNKGPTAESGSGSKLPGPGGGSRIPGKAPSRNTPTAKEDMTPNNKGSSFAKNQPRKSSSIDTKPAGSFDSSSDSRIIPPSSKTPQKTATILKPSSIPNKGSLLKYSGSSNQEISSSGSSRVRGFGYQLTSSSPDLGTYRRTSSGAVPERVTMVVGSGGKTPDGQHPSGSGQIGSRSGLSTYRQTTAGTPGSPHLNRSSPSCLDSSALVENSDNIDKILNKSRTPLIKIGAKGSISSLLKPPSSVSFPVVSGIITSVISDNGDNEDMDKEDREIAEALNPHPSLIPCSENSLQSHNNYGDDDAGNGSGSVKPSKDLPYETLEAAQHKDNCLNPLNPAAGSQSADNSPEDQDLSPINAFDQDSGNETGQDEYQYLELTRALGEPDYVKLSHAQGGTDMVDSFNGLLDSYHELEDNYDGLSAPSEDQGLASSMEGELDDRGISSTIQIYTDWANHYLEKSRYTRFITDLQVDICDGVLLADIINAVTNETICDIHPKPCNATQMVENVSTCLSFLAGLGVNVDGLSARDIRDGNLKAILGLFFSLSRFKQQQKSQTTSSQNQQNHNTTPTTKAQQRALSPTTSTFNSNLGNHLGYHSNSRPSSRADNLNSNGNSDMQSRLPSPQKGSALKCPTVNSPHVRENHSRGQSPTSSSSNNLNKLSKTHYSSSLERGRQQLATCPNNNVITNSGSLGKTGNKEASKESGIPSRATSPNPRTIPTRTSRSLGPRSSTDKVSKPAPSESGTSSLRAPSRGQSAPATQKSASAGSVHTAVSNKDKSMLDKFKLFKDKGDKGKGASKSGKSSKDAAVSSSSAAPTPKGAEKSKDSKSSRSSEGASGGAAPSQLPNGTASPKLGLKLSKKGVPKKKDTSPTTPQSSTSSLSRDDHARRTSSSSSIPSRTASSNSVSSTASNSNKKPTARYVPPPTVDRIPDHQRQTDAGQSSPSTGRKTSRLGSITPTKNKALPPPRHGSSTPTQPPSSFLPSASTPTGGSGIPKPGSSSTGRTPKDSSKSRSSNSKSSVSSLPGSSRGRDQNSSSSSLASSAGGTQGLSPQDIKPLNLLQGHNVGTSHEHSPRHMSGQQSSHPGAPRQLAMDPKQGITSKSMKVNNTNFAQQDISPEKITSSMHDKNANMRSSGNTGSMGRSDRGAGSNTRNQKLNNSKSSERLHGSKSSERLQYNLSPAPQSNNSRSASPNPASIPCGIPPSHSAKVPNRTQYANSGPQGEVMKPHRVDSDTQTAGSVVHANAVKQQQMMQHQQQMMQQQYRQQQQQQHQQQQQQQQQHRSQMASPQGHSLPSPRHHQSSGSSSHGSLPRSHNNGAQQSPSQHGPPQVPQVTMPKAHAVMQMGKATISQQQKYSNVPPQHAQNPHHQGLQSQMNHGGHPQQNRLDPSQARASSKPQDRRQHLKDPSKHSNSSLSSAGEDSNLSSNSTSNSNNSASSTDSVIYRPSSCDELESGADSDSAYGVPNAQPPPQPVALDHIASLRQQKRDKESPQRNAPKKIETTFDTEVHTQEQKPKPEPSKETTLGGGEEMDSFDVDIKPMQPLMRSTPYAYLRNLPLLRPSLHIPHLSSQNSGLASSASSRLGVNRPLIDPSRMYHMKRTMSNSLDNDYGSDVEGFDVAAGYMSDGDILTTHHTEDINSGYMSEGGASLYAKKMQQRFREGIMAVKECMQKSAGMPDDDSFDDSSSISSGDISDTINELSTDDNITGSSLSETSSERTNPYSSLKRAPPGGPPIHVPRGIGPGRQGPFYAKAGNLLGRNVNLHGRDNLDNILGENWKKYCISEDGGSANSNYADPKDLKQYPIGIPGALFIKKKSNQATITDLRSRSLRPPQQGGVAVAVEESQFGEAPSHDVNGGIQKRDSETNTDHSVMMMRRAAGRQPSGGAPPVAGFGFRRPLSTSSNASNSSTGSRGSNRMDATEAMKGERLSNYNKGVISMGRPGTAPPRSVTSPGSKESNTDMGPQAYSASTLERKKKGNLISSNTQTTITTATSPNDYQSNTLGRKRTGEPNLKDRMFGSRSSLNKVQHQQLDGQMNGTIISNPHATYGKDRHLKSGEISPNGHNYVNINYLSPDGMPPRPLSGLSSPGNGYSWPKSNGSCLGNGMRMALSETESMESLSSSASSNIQAQIQQARASALASRNILQGLNSNHPSIHRSDSFKSTKSERAFPTSHSDAVDLQRTGSYTQLIGASDSHAPNHQRLGSYPLSGLVSTTTAGLVGSLSRPGSSASSSSPYANVFLPLSKLSSSKEDDLHGSALSLVSSSSSVYSTAEEKQSSEIKKLRRELELAQEKVFTLSNQLNTNAHVVAAFEQSLSNMTHRLQTLSQTAESKDSELSELRSTIASLKEQSGNITICPDSSFSPSSTRRQSNNSSLCREPTTPGSESTKGLTRNQSTGSVTSLNSMSSACSATSQQSSATDCDKDKKGKKKKNWLRSSFSKAFSRGKKPGKNGSMSDAEIDCQSVQSDASVPNSPLLHIPHPMSMPTTPIKSSNSASLLGDAVDGGDGAVLDLRQKLHEKDMKLTEMRLESLSSVHQLEQLRDAMNRMKSEMHSLKADNDRLHRLMTSKGLSPTSPHAESLEKRLSLGDPSSLDLMLTESPDRDGRRITLSVYLNTTNDFCKLSEGQQSEVLIGAISVSGKTKWDMLDSVVRRAFKEYILRIDPVTNLGLNGDSVLCYNIGDILRNKEAGIPELLPCGYLVGENTNIAVTLKGNSENSVDSLSFDALIPRSIVQRYISLLQEHKRIILCGPSGTGKTFLAQKLAEYLVIRSGKELTAGAIATFNVDHKSSKELRQYLANIADQCDSTAAGELPNVIILDNLHHVTSLGEVFNGFLSVKHHQCPYIIGTMNQTTCSTTNLQLHHNFRWVLCANHMEPVKGFLGRFLRRKLVQEEVKSGTSNGELSKIVDWIPKVWQHLNKFLETHSSSDVTIGPRLFLSCPMDSITAQVWFTDLWNYSLVPYLLEAVREGIQLYGRRAPWEDPVDWVTDTYPWIHPGSGEWPSLLKLRPEDVGYDTQGAPTSGQTKTSQNPQQSDTEGDPLMTMLMRLQEAASYSSPQSNDSDSTSMDSHSSAQDLTQSSGGSAPTSEQNTPKTKTKSGIEPTKTKSSIESTI